MIQELSRSWVKCNVSWPKEIEGLNYTTGSQLKINWLSWPFRRLCCDKTMRGHFIHLIANNKIGKYTCDATSRYTREELQHFLFAKNFKKRYVYIISYSCEVWSVQRENGWSGYLKQILATNYYWERNITLNNMYFSLNVWSLWIYVSLWIFKQQKKGWF